MKNFKFLFACVSLLMLIAACADRNDEPEVEPVAQSVLNQDIVSEYDAIEYYFIPQEYYFDNLTWDDFRPFLSENHLFVAGGGFYYQIIIDDETRIGTFYDNGIYFPLTASGVKIELLPILSKPQNGILDLHLIRAEKQNGEYMKLIYPDEFVNYGLIAKSNGEVEFDVPLNDSDSEIRWHLYLESDDEYKSLIGPGIKRKYTCEMLFVQLAKGQKYEDVK